MSVSPSRSIRTPSKKSKSIPPKHGVAIAERSTPVTLAAVHKRWTSTAGLVFAGEAKDHTASVSLPPWLADPAPGYVTPFSYGADEYDYILQEGHKNIGAWIDRAAQRGGR